MLPGSIQRFGFNQKKFNRHEKEFKSDQSKKKFGSLLTHTSKNTFQLSEILVSQYLQLFPGDKKRKETER